MDLAIKLIVLLPLLAAAIAGLFCRIIGDRPAQLQDLALHHVDLLGVHLRARGEDLALHLVDVVLDGLGDVEVGVHDAVGDGVQHRGRAQLELLGVGLEPAAGLTRSFMAFLIDAYHEDEAPNAKGGVDKRTVLRLDPRLAPVKAAVLPLSRHADLSPKARDLAAELRKCWNVDFDDAGAIGRRYRRQDEIGTPYCVTLDFDSLEDHAVTIRERDAMTQERVAIDAVSDYLGTRLRGC